MEQVIENNKLIALFMGSEFSTLYPDNKTFRYYTPPTKHSSFEWSLSHMQYHTSWDWLMPVVEKIYNTATEHDRQFAEMVIFELGIASELSMVYSACIQFIKFYNSQTSNNEPK